jgi:hypothetical protein
MEPVGSELQSRTVVLGVDRKRWNTVEPKECAEKEISWLPEEKNPRKDETIVCQVGRGTQAGPGKRLQTR